ncbi:hypothetical protein AWENTII_007470 [Aspergillus wentii]
MLVAGSTTVNDLNAAFPMWFCVLASNLQQTWFYFAPLIKMDEMGCLKKIFFLCRDYGYMVSPDAFVFFFGYITFSFVLLLFVGVAWRSRLLQFCSPHCCAHLDP